MATSPSGEHRTCHFCNSKATHWIIYDCGDTWRSVIDAKDYECSAHPRAEVCMWCRELLQQLTAGSFHESRLEKPVRHTPMTESAVVKAVEEILLHARPPRPE